MKRFKKVGIIIISVALVLFLSGCSALVQSFENEEHRDYTDIMLNAVLMDDSEAAYTLVSDVCSETDFDPVFKEMRTLLKDVKSYELKLISINQRFNYDNNEKVTTVDSVYEMKTEKQRYVISVQSNSAVEKLSAFYITPYEKTNLYYTGVIGKMKDASVLQWGFLLSNLVAIALMTVLVIDCCRKRIKYKPLWIILIILGVVSLGATISATSFHFNFNYMWLAGYSAFIRYGGGQVTVRFLIPWGIVPYILLRNWLIKKAKPIEDKPSPEIDKTEQPTVE